MTATAAPSGRFRHLALFYHGRGEYLAALCGFIQASRARGDAVFVAVPERKAQLVRQELLDRVVGSLFQVGHSLQTAIDLPREAARERISEALGRLDDTIREIRDYVFTTRPGSTAGRSGATQRPRVSGTVRVADDCAPRGRTATGWPGGLRPRT